MCGFLIGVLPAVQATRTDPHEFLLKADARTGGSRGGEYLRQALVVAELALSVVLLLGAGLMRSFLNIQRIDRGFDPRGVLTMRLTLPRERYPGDAAGAFFDRLAERLAGLPACAPCRPRHSSRHRAPSARSSGWSEARPRARPCLRRRSPSRRRATSKPWACRFAQDAASMRPIASTRRSWRWSTRHSRAGISAAAIRLDSDSRSAVPIKLAPG